VIEELSLTQFIINRFIDTKHKLENKHGFKFSDLTEKELLDIRNILSPRMEDLNPFINNKDTYKWLGLSNFEIFSGLNKNQRVLIEGIPGCGKTTLHLLMQINEGI
jgi:hypothetical protein